MQKLEFKKLVRYFFQGLLFLAPVVITLYVVYAMFSALDGMANDIIESWFGFRIWGMGLLLMLTGITFIGYLSSTFLFSPFFDWFERLVARTPLVKIIYSSIRDLFSAFVGDAKKFDKPVLVTLIPDAGLYKMGFITKEDLSELGMPGKVAVYFPHSYNFSGNLYIVKRENVEHIEGLNSADAMKFIVSGGVTDLDAKEEKA